MGEKALFSYGNGLIHYHHTLTPNPDPDLFPFRLHSHNMHEIYYFVQGCADFTVEGVTYRLEKGMLLLSASGQVHHLSINDRNVPYERIVIMFGIGKSSAYINNSNSFSDGQSRIFKLSEREQTWFEESCLAIESSNLSEKDLEVAIESLTNMILIKLSAISEVTHRNEQQNNETVNQIIRYINRNLTSELSLDMISRELFRDKAYLNRIFKNVMGCGIWEYVIQKRVFNARQQLYLTKSVSAAFSSSGFRDYSVFYRNYVRCTGLSPTSDLKKLIEEDKDK